jgi:hypothetical protein
VLGIPNPAYRSRGAKEYIVSAAIQCRRTGDVILGSDHPELLSEIPACRWRHYEAGFYFNTGRFLSREPALAVARAARQVSASELRRRGAFMEDGRVRELLSEMIGR